MPARRLQNLLGLRATAATVIGPDGMQRSVAVENVEPGMRLAIAAGSRIPADGEILTGISDVDTSLVTGESLPEPVKPGSAVYAGTLNIGAPLTMRVTKRDDDSLLAEIVRLMEAAEQGRARYVRIADRAARIYSPAVHIMAFSTMILWFALDAHWETALTHAIAVLIITCPCALGLAVPVVQVVATGRLIRQGVFVKAADALERLAQADTIVFDKTGTLTLGRPQPRQRRRDRARRLGPRGRAGAAEPSPAGARTCRSRRRHRRNESHGRYRSAGHGA